MNDVNQIYVKFDEFILNFDFEILITSVLN